MAAFRHVSFHITQSAALEQTLSFENRIGKSRFCIAETFFNKLSNQKTARLPAAPENEGLAAKPRTILKIQLQGEAG